MFVGAREQRYRIGLIGLIPLILTGVGYAAFWRVARPVVAARPSAAPAPVVFHPRRPIDTSGYSLIVPAVKPWNADSSLDEIAASWRVTTPKYLAWLDEELKRVASDEVATSGLRLVKAVLLNSEADPVAASEVLEEARAAIATSPEPSSKMLYTIIYFQGVTALRRGENDNCVMCRGESSCILPISPAAVHRKPRGSRDAIRYFTEYLQQFPNDLEVRWLLNIAHMTLGEHPEKVDPKYLISINRFVKSEFDIGRFRDVGHLLGVNRLNQAGGVIMDDFDNDGRLDLFVTTFDATGSAAFYHNKGDGTFEERGESAGLAGQLGGLTCSQADYNNDGRMDIFIPRGAWLDLPIRPTLLRNDGGTFTDVTVDAKLTAAFNANAVCWADYDNDGFVDLFVPCEKQSNLLYHNLRNGKFEEVARAAGVDGVPGAFAKGATWIDFDNDGAPDLFLNNLNGFAQLFHNEGNGQFLEVTIPLKINGPLHGFSCWTFDFDNDGWLDIFATCYDRSLGDVVGGMLGRPHGQNVSRLFRNVQGKRFEDVTEQAGLDLVYATMGSNYGDFDNDGFLDFYLGTGEPSLATLIPNRMFKNVDGKRFSEITGTSGTGHLQKGHGVAIGDWDRDGDVDVFIETGGAINGDKYHNVLFQNPGQGNHWLTVKLVGEKSNRAAAGRSDQGRHARRPVADDSPPRFLREQLRR